MTETFRANTEIKNVFPKMDAIVILGTSAVLDEETGQYHYPIVEDGVTSAGEFRLMGAEIAYRNNLSFVFIITGGKQIVNGRITERADIFMNELNKRYGVPLDGLRPIGKTGHTYGNMQDAADYLQTHPQILKIGRVGVLSNRYQLTRALLMGHSIPFFRKQKIDLVPVPAEALMVIDCIENAQLIAEAYNTPEYQRRMEMENKGIKAWIEGQYQIPQA